MSRTEPTQFVGKAELTPRKLAAIHEMYVDRLRDSDVAGETEVAAYYDGAASAFEDVLNILYDQHAHDVDAD